ncbi:MAG TPA: hypothetical protein VFN35_20615 [Ktedonobacteraceae bacterium]|nr:hypothetical protein [Ktedonobacteraceae bacterium]
MLVKALAKGSLSFAGEGLRCSQARSLWLTRKGIDMGITLANHLLMMQR